MTLYHRHTLPTYTEQALGYVWEKPLARWVGVYRNLKGEGVWNDGMAWDALPEGLLTILERRWGTLPPEHAYLLDLEYRWMDVVAIAALDAVLQDVGPTQRFEAWVLEAAEAQRVSQMLVAYGERLVRRARQQGCGACHHGYQWIPVAAQFVPCVACNPTGE